MRNSWVKILLVAGDILALLLAFFAGYEVAHLLSVEIFDRYFMSMWYKHSHYFVFIYGFLSLAALYVLHTYGHYRQRTPWWDQVRQIGQLCLVMMLVAGFMLYLLKLPFSRLWVTCAWLCAIPLLLMFRLIIRKICLWFKVWGGDVIVIGGLKNTLETLYALKTDIYNQYNVRHIYLVDAKDVIAKDELPQSLQNCPQDVLAKDEILKIVKKFPRHLIILAPDTPEQFDPTPIFNHMKSNPGGLAFVPPIMGLSLYGMEMQNFFGSHTILMRPRYRMGGHLNRTLKRIMDIGCALVGILLLALPMSFIAWTIAKDKGPIFYSQQRIGKNGKMFACWKFRSMVPNADAVIKDLLASDAKARKEWEQTFKLKNDPRITRVGALLRKTSLDELPQLWNILKGDMSVVGPRPIVKDELTYYGESKSDYLSIKPGLTGLWQVSGRNDTSYAYRVYLDRWYVSHWSIWTDIVIILLTIGIIVNRRGAY